MENIIAVKPLVATADSAEKYDALIDTQHAIGYWKESAKETLKKFFENGDINDDAVKVELGSVVDEERAYLTLVALHVLEEEYVARETEWSLIADKGKNYLRKVGVENPHQLLKKFTLKSR